VPVPFLLQHHIVDKYLLLAEHSSDEKNKVLIRRIVSHSREKELVRMPQSAPPPTKGERKVSTQAPREREKTAVGRWKEAAVSSCLKKIIYFSCKHDPNIARSLALCMQIVSEEGEDNPDYCAYEGIYSWQ
jgi:hypothetical protein